MKKLKNYYKLPFTQIRVNYGGEKISFSLIRELSLNPDDITSNMVDQPKMYGFCLMLHKKLLTEFEKSKLNKNKTWGRLYFQAKELKSKSTGRPYSDDMAKAWVDKHPDYIKACLECIQIKDNADAIFSCIKSFEQRKDLAQSISSNIRNER